jgi:hypothetical protein
MPKQEPIYFKCKRKTSEIDEYIEAIKGSTLTPAQFVRREEGTYNPITDRFCCIQCYIDLGQPSLPAPNRWKAP